MLQKLNPVKDCPLCFGETIVVDSRTDLSSGTILRKRECKECHHRFKTQEILREDLIGLVRGKSL